MPAIASFSAGQYLELIAPDPARADDRNLGGHLAMLEDDRLLGWLRVDPRLPGGRAGDEK